MPVIHVERWHRARHPRAEQAVDFCSSLTTLERSLRDAGFDIAADLVSAAGIAVLQKLGADSELR